MAAYQQQQQLPFGYGDTTLTKVFVGGLAWETGSETLRRHFQQFGDILEAAVIYDKHTGRSKGYGFVTFRDPGAAARACADPSPVIDGRRANCNLAALGRPPPPLPPPPPPPYGRLRPSAPMFGGVQATRGPHSGTFGYHPHLSYGYQQGFIYPSYGYPAYGTEYVYPQGIYSPYMGQQYPQMYGMPGTLNNTLYPYGQLGQTLPGGRGYTAVQGYALPSQVVQYGGHSANAITTSPMPTIQAPSPSGVVTPVFPRQFIAPPASPRFEQSSSSAEQTTG